MTFAKKLLYCSTALSSLFLPHKTFKKIIVYTISVLQLLQGPFLSVAFAGKTRTPLVYAEDTSKTSSIRRAYRASVAHDQDHEYCFTLNPNVLKPSTQLSLLDTLTQAPVGILSINEQNQLSFEGTGSFRIGFEKNEPSSSSSFDSVLFQVTGNLRLYDDLKALEQTINVSDTFKNKAHVVGLNKLNLKSQRFINKKTLETQDSLNLDVGQGQNHGLLQSARELSLNFQTAFENGEEGRILAEKQLSLGKLDQPISGTLDNFGTLWSAHTLTLSLPHIKNAGTLRSDVAMEMSPKLYWHNQKKGHGYIPLAQNASLEFSLENDGEINFGLSLYENSVVLKQLINRKTMHTQGGHFTFGTYHNSGFMENKTNPLYVTFSEDKPLHVGTLLSNTALYILRGEMINEGFIKAPHLWIRSMAENKGVLAATCASSLDAFQEGEKIHMEPWMKESGLFLGIKEHFINHGKILAPEGAIFFGENAKIPFLSKASQTSSSTLWDYVGPFMPGEHGFLNSASFENKGELYTGKSPLMIRNVHKVILHPEPDDHLSLPPSTQIDIFNKMLLKAEGDKQGFSFQLDKLSSFLSKGHLHSGDLIVETALFSPQKISRFNTLPENALGRIELHGDIHLTKGKDSLLWLSAKNILNNTSLSEGNLYSCLIAGHQENPQFKTIPVFENNNLIRMCSGVIQGLVNRGTVQFEEDFGTPELSKKQSTVLQAYGYNETHPLDSTISRNEGMMYIDGNVKVSTQGKPTENTGTFELLGNGHNLHFTGPGTVKIGSCERAPDKISLTFSQEMGELFLNTQVYAQAKLLNISKYTKNIQSVSSLGLDISNDIGDLLFQGSLLVKGNLDIMDRSKAGTTRFILERPSNVTSTLTDSFDFKGSAIESGDVVATGQIQFHSQRGLENRSGRIISPTDVIMGSKAYNGIIHNDSLIMGLQSISLYADRIMGKGTLKTEGLLTLMGGEIDVSEKNIKSRSLQMIAQRGLKLQKVGTSVEGDMYLEGPSIVFSAPVGATNITAIMNKGIVAAHISANERLYLEAKENLDQTPTGKMSGKDVMVKSDKSMTLRGDLEAKRNLIVRSSQLDLMNAFLKANQMLLDAQEFTSQNSRYQSEVLNVKARNARMQHNSFMNQYSSFKTNVFNSTGDTHNSTHMSVDTKDFSSHGSTYQGKSFGLVADDAQMNCNAFRHGASSFKANTMGAFGNTHTGQSHSFDIGSFRGGVHGAVNMVDGLSGVSQVSLKMATQDYENKGPKTFGHSNISLSFASVKNTGEIKANGKLKLHGERFFTNTASISAKDDLFTTTKGIHRNDGLLESKQGTNYVEGDKIVSRAHEEMDYKYGWLSQVTGIGATKKIVRPQYKGRHVVQKAENGIDHVGVDIQAKENISLHTKQGDIHLDPYTHHVKTKYDVLKKHESSRMTGGGNINVHAETGGIQGHGLQATAGQNMGFKAQKDIDLRSIAEVYTSERESGSGFLGFNSWHREKQSADFTQTNLKAGQTLSAESTNGGINLQGANLVSETKEIALEVQKNIDLGALKVTLHERNDSSSWWGLSGTKKSGYHQKAKVFGATAHDHVGTRSHQGKVIGEGAQFRAKSVSIHGEKGIELNELLLEKAESVKNYGLDFTIFGFNIFKPTQFKGPNASVSIGYSEDTQSTKMTGAIHGSFTTDHATFSTGKGSFTDVRGSNLSGLTKEAADLTLDTDKFMTGGSKQEILQTSTGGGGKIGVNVLAWTPEVEGSGFDKTKTQVTYQKGIMKVGHLTNKREGTEVHLSQGIDGYIQSSSGEPLQLTVDHAQSKETQSGGGGGAKIGVDKFHAHAEAQWGEKVSSEGLTNFTLGKNTQNLTRTDNRHKDYNTQGKIGASIGISEEGIDFGVQAQFGDQSFEVSSQTLKDIDSFAEGLGDLSKLQFPMNLHEAFDTAQNILNKANTASSLLQNMGVEVPENVQKFMNTAKTVVDITQFVDSQLSDGVLQKAFDQFKIPESFNELISQGNGALSKLTGVISQAKTMGVPIPGSIDNVLNQTQDILKGTEMLTHMIGHATHHGPQDLKATDFKASFADITTYGKQLMTNLTGVQDVLQKMSIPLPEELQNVIKTGTSVLNTTETLYQGLYEGAFIQILGNSALPQLVEEVVGQTQTFLKGLKPELGLGDKLPQSFKTFFEGMDAVKEGIEMFHKAQNLSDKLNVLSSHDGLQQGLSRAPGLQKTIIEELPKLKGHLSPQDFSSLEETLKSTSYLIAQTSALQDRLREVQFAKDMIFGEGQMMDALFQEGLDLEGSFNDTKDLMKRFGITSQDEMIDFIARGRGTLNILQDYQATAHIPETPLEVLVTLSHSLPLWKDLGIEVPQHLQNFLQNQEEIHDVMQSFQSMMQIGPASIDIQYPKGWDKWTQTLTESLVTLQETINVFDSFKLASPKAQAFVTDMATVLQTIKGIQEPSTKDQGQEGNFLKAALSTILTKSTVNSNQTKEQ